MDEFAKERIEENGKQSKTKLTVVGIGRPQGNSFV